MSLSPFRRLRQAYPNDDTWPQRHRQAIGTGLFVSAFLWFFRPFGLEGLPAGFQLWQVALAYGAVTMGLMYFYALLARLVGERRWTVGHEIVANIALLASIAVGNLLLTALLFGKPVHWANLLMWLYITLGIGIFPIVFFALFTQYRNMQRYVREAADLDESLDENQMPQDSAPPAPSAKLLVQGSNQGEDIWLNSSEFLFAEAAGNYVKILVEAAGKKQQHLLRCTMSELAAQLEGWPQVLRCHRSYLVNLERVRHVSGNAQGYKLHLSDADAPVPVSRHLNPLVREKLLRYPVG